MKLRWYVALIFIAFSMRSNAAELLVVPGNPVLYIMGEITSGDEAAVAELIDQNTIEMVALRGPGGDLDTAYSIGQIIINRGLPTAVIDGEDCASACSLIFLAGVSRTLPSDSRVGFHLPFIPVAQSPSQGDSVAVTQYCRSLERAGPGRPWSTVSPRCIELTYQLGFEDAYRLTLWVQRSGVDPHVMSLIADTPPDQIRWVRPDEAQRLRIANVNVTTGTMEAAGEVSSFEEASDPLYACPETAALTSLEAELTEALLALTRAEAEAQSCSVALSDLEQQLAAALSAQMLAEGSASEQLSLAEQRAALLAQANLELETAEAASAESQRQISALNEQVATLRTLAARLQGLLEASRSSEAAALAQVETLGADLNAALARLAVELNRTEAECSPGNN